MSRCRDRKGGDLCRGSLHCIFRSERDKQKDTTMQGAPRLKPWRVRQLYQCIRLGIFDEDKLLHIGWGLYARGEAVLMFGQARRGQVPCPQCDQIVYRRNFYRQRPSAEPSASLFSCPICGEKVTWHDCRDALRNHPRCFDCRKILAWNYSTNTLACSSCKQTWTWQKYRHLSNTACDSLARIATISYASHHLQNWDHQK